MDSWQQAVLALRLLAIDPGLGGVTIRARSGPVRDALLNLLDPTAKRIHPAISDEALFGGLDLSATLTSGHLVEEQGLLAKAGPMLLAMAERAPVRLAAHLSIALDRTVGHTMNALDEGAAPDEAVDPTLAARLAFHIDLSDVTLHDVSALPTRKAEQPATFPARGGYIAAQGRVLPSMPPEITEQLTQIAAQLGIDSLRAPLFALRAAKAHAILQNRDTLTQDDVEIACALTLAHRATRVPEPEPQQPDTAPNNTESQSSEDTLDIPDELLLDAVRALLPDNLLERLAAQKARQGRGTGTGAARKGTRRGRPLPSRQGRLDNGARLDLIGTLRAAAPWQTIRRKASERKGLHIQPSDFRIKRYEEKSDRLLIFTVDASGSAALTRLAEAKGAVELLLGQAKRRLAGLPGGGGTPLAAGMVTAVEQATTAQRKGLTPTIAILTDGRANIALDGTADRKQAAKDAQQISKVIRSHGTDAIVIDTGNRPEPALRNLAQTMDAAYLPLPRADAQSLSDSVATVLGE